MTTGGGSRVWDTSGARGEPIKLGNMRGGGQSLQAGIAVNPSVLGVKIHIWNPYKAKRMTVKGSRICHCKFRVCVF